MSARLMAHMIAYYPDEAASARVVRALVDGGASHIEIQFPFSDPSADGPVIEGACTEALRSGFTVDKGFEFVARAAELCRPKGIPILVMTYASLVFTRGVRRFAHDAATAGASGLIVPDLPFDSDEGLNAACRAEGIENMNVIIPSMNRQRLDALLGLKPTWIYCALRAGITGVRTELGKDNLAFLDVLARSGTQVFAGFGIEAPEQVKVLSQHVYAAIVGSALVRKVKSGALDKPGPDGLEAYVSSLVSV